VPAASARAGADAGAAAAGATFAAAVAERYRPLRRFRKLASLWSVRLPAEARLQSCLLEFGERVALTAGGGGGGGGGDDGDGSGGGAKGGAARGGTDFERKFAALQRAARADEELARRAAVERERGLMEQMADAKAGVSGSSLGLFVGLQSEELRRAADEYRAKEEELRALAESGGLMAVRARPRRRREVARECVRAACPRPPRHRPFFPLPPQNTKMGRAAAHARKLAALQSRLDGAGEARAGAAAAREAAAGEDAAARAALAKAAKYNARAEARIAELDASVAALPPEAKAQLRALFERYSRAEAVKADEAAFKASCASHLDDLRARAARLAAEAASGDAARALADMAAAHGEAAGRLDRARAAVAARTREADRLARLIDDVPSRAELSQYEKRFVELYDEVTEKLDETRKYFAAYNTLARKKEYLGKEEALVASMLANFSALASRGQRQSYLDQCAAFTATMEESLAKQGAQLDARRRARDARAADVQRLVDLQRAYYKAVKDFQDECKQNEALAADAARRKQAAAAAAAE
jgi:hypothetical protein